MATQTSGRRRLEPVSINEADNEAMIRQIVDAAEQCFRQYGVHRTRMEDIAQHVGLVRPNLYRFVAKEALILRVVLEHTAKVDAERRKRIPFAVPSVRSSHNRSCSDGNSLPPTSSSAT